MVHVVVIGTAGNQSYIFESNKRRENVGASFLITQVEDGWLKDTLPPAAAEAWAGAARDGTIAEDARIERYGKTKGHPGVEIVTANAGGVVALVADRQIGCDLVTGVTRAALWTAPGLDVYGVVGEPFEWGDNLTLEGVTLDGAIRRTRDLLPAARMAGPGPARRFQGLPIAAMCESSGLPAKELLDLADPNRRGRREPTRPEPRSAQSAAKLDHYEKALARLVTKLDLVRHRSADSARRELRRVVAHLEEDAEWVAVVHADGNGLGKVFESFGAVCKWAGARDYVDRLRGLSNGVDECARRAAIIALDRLQSVRDKAADRSSGQDAGKTRSKRVAELLPLVLGGDDLTVICDGRLALPFTETYLKEFAREAAAHEGVTNVLGRAAGKEEVPDRLGACAGVAIVKRHYPFHFAAGLAEDLTKDAKQVKKPLGPSHCALSFHVLYESAAADLKRLRGYLNNPGRQHSELEEVWLTAQPYVVGEIRNESGEARRWAQGRHWDALKLRVDALNRVDDDGARLVPAGQAHDLRSGLFLGRDTAEARFSLLARRLGAAVADLAGATPGASSGEDDELFWRSTTKNGEPVWVTGLLDAMNACDFLPHVPDDRTGRTSSVEAVEPAGGTRTEATA